MTFPIVHSDTYNLHNPTFEIWPGGRMTTLLRIAAAGRDHSRGAARDVVGEDA